MRTPHGQYDEYHTSADNLDFIGAEALQESLELCIEAIDEAQHDLRYINLNPKCEPQLGRRGLYEPIGGESQSSEIQLAQLWLLSYSDGEHSLADIRDLSGIDSSTLGRAAERLEAAGLLKAENQ
jgi:aminopeptidase-like protein